MLKSTIKNCERIRENVESFLFSNEIFTSRAEIMKHKHEKYKALLLKMLTRDIKVKNSYILTAASFSDVLKLPGDLFKD